MHDAVTVRVGEPRWESPAARQVALGLAPFKACACGARYTQEEWLKLPLIGVQAWPWGGKDELRNCVGCTSTLAIVLEEGEPEDDGDVQPQRAEFEAYEAEERFDVEAFASEEYDS